MQGYERKRRVSWETKLVLFGSGMSVFLSLLMWAFQMMPVLIWITFPGWLLAWATIALLQAQEWKHASKLALVLVTVGNATLYSGILLLIKRRAEKSPSVGPE